MISRILIQAKQPGFQLIRNFSSRSILFNGIQKPEIKNEIKPETNEIKDESKKLSPEERKREAAKLAMQSLKDMGSLFSVSDDPATEVIKTEPIFKNPLKFKDLNVLHQGQVITELNEKLEDKWDKLTIEDKKLNYYISYGAWGPRENFNEWDKLTPPIDLPFKIPSEVKDFKPNSNTIIKELPPVNLYELDVRKKEFDFKRLDGLTRFFMYLILTITVLAIYRDKIVGEAGQPKEITVPEFDFEAIDTKRREDEIKRKLITEKELEDKISEEVKKIQDAKRGKWYYLWLK